MRIRSPREPDVVGSPLAAVRSQEVPVDSPCTQLLAQSMLRFVTQFNETSGQAPLPGLSAPQFGARERIILVDLAIGTGEEPDYGAYANPTVFARAEEKVEVPDRFKRAGDTSTLFLPAWVVVVGFDIFNQHDGAVQRGDGDLSLAFQQQLANLDAHLPADQVANAAKSSQAE